MPSGPSGIDPGRHAAERLRRFANRSKAIHDEYLSNPDLLHAYKAFVAWQVDYMYGFYDDLRATPGYADALDFVITDLTGIGISQRDRDLARVVPVMARMLPERALHTIAAAMELNARALEINLSVCRRLFQDRSPDDGISEADFCHAYRQSTELDECLALVTLTRRVGESLERVVHAPAIGMLLRAMHGPAHLAGFGALHDFLESGYNRFKGIDDVDAFLDVTSRRMGEVLNRMFSAPPKELDVTRSRAAPAEHREYRKR